MESGNRLAARTPKTQSTRSTSLSCPSKTQKTTCRTSRKSSAACVNRYSRLTKVDLNHAETSRKIGELQLSVELMIHESKKIISGTGIGFANSPQELVAALIRESLKLESDSLPKPKPQAGGRKHSESDLSEDPAGPDPAQPPAEPRQSSN